MTAVLSWADSNQQDLVRCLERVRRHLERHAQQPVAAAPPQPAAPEDEVDEAPESALASLRALFDLTGFERDVLLLCAGLEMDARFAPAVAAAQGVSGGAAPTFGLALSVLPGAHWSALTPSAPLRAWNLIEVSGAGVTAAPLRINERVLHFLAGLNDVDERLHALAALLPAVALSGADRDIASRVAARLEREPSGFAVQISGGDAARRAGVAAHAAGVLRANALRVQVPEALPAADRHLIARLVAREARLLPAVSVVDTGAQPDEPKIASFVEALGTASLVLTAEPLAALAGRAPAFELAPATRAERFDAWSRALGDYAEAQNGAIPAVCAQFNLGELVIRGVAAQVKSSDPDGEQGTRLWDACREAARPRMDGLAARIEAVAGWDDLVLPEPQQRTLRQIAAHARRRDRVFGDWGFASKSTRGLGLSVLFAGASGTGKTMAAEVLARELRLDLYRIDLATVVSKYIGETEKNLKRLFDAAEGSGAILLFDEADALFGKRSDVRDSHDRYANIEISYLLQRMESYGGLAILTTNMRQAIDPAFLRRLRFIVQFPFPDASHRAEIWQRIFPDAAPTRLLDYRQLSQLNLAGGHIRNVALAGAFIAADRGEPIGMEHLAEAARSEYVKLERTLTDAETRGWA
jgi:AAA+ superfamily predicted ATPase